MLTVISTYAKNLFLTSMNTFRSLLWIMLSRQVIQTEFITVSTSIILKNVKS